MAITGKKLINRIFKNGLYWIIFILFFSLTYFHWLKSGQNTWGDWYPWPEPALLEWRHFNIWWRQDSLGRSFMDLGSSFWAVFFWLEAQLVYFLHLPYTSTSKIIWFIPFIVFSLSSMRILWLTVFPKDSRGWFLASIVYTFNTYILLLTMGGHITVAVVYAMLPLLLALTIKSLTYKGLFWPFLASLFWIIASYYEIRIFILAIVIVIFSVFVFLEKIDWKRLCLVFLIFAASLILAHLWWIMPFIAQSTNIILPSGNLSIDKSYINLAHALFLYHPQWPDNVLGKINQIPAWFLVYPLGTILFTYLLIRNNRHTKAVIYFTLLFLVGAFLSKGLSFPFGGIYQLLFDHLPLFKMFRDASKFYVFISFSLSMIAGMGFGLIQEKQLKLNLPITIITILIYLMLFYPAIRLGSHGTFVLKNKPAEYWMFDQLMIRSPKFYRVAWLPKFSRWSFFSENHPRLGLVDLSYHEWSSLLDKPGNIQKFFSSDEGKFLLDSASVKYIALPYDSEQDIYSVFGAKDSYLKILSDTQWLKDVSNSKIRLYENKGYYPEIYATNQAFFISNHRLVGSIVDQQNKTHQPAVVIFGQDHFVNQHFDQVNYLNSLDEIEYVDQNTSSAKVNIVQDGEFTIVTKNEDTVVEIGDKKLVNGDRIALNKGQYMIFVHTSHSPQLTKNLLPTENLKKCTPTQDTIQFSHISNLDNMPEIQSEGHTSCLSVKIIDLKENEKYQISLGSKTIGQGLVKMGLETDSGDNQEIELDPLNESSRLTFKTAKDTFSANFIFKVIGNNIDFKINQLTLFGPILRVQAEDVIFQEEATNQIMNNVQYKIISKSSSHYQIQFSNVQNDFFINFGDLYNPDWSATIVKNGQSLGQSGTKHFISNGWSNGWQITQKGNFVVDLRFMPDKTYQRWKHISQIWLILLALIIIINITVKKRVPKNA